MYATTMTTMYAKTPLLDRGESNNSVSRCVCVYHVTVSYRGCACDVTNRTHVMHTVILSVNCKKQRALLSFVSCTAQ